MISGVKSVKENRLNTLSFRWFDLLFGLIPLICITPLACLEFRTLWQQPAMRFFPIPIVVVAALAAWNWKSDRSTQPTRVMISRMLFLLGITAFSASVLRFSPLLAHVSFVILFISWSLEHHGNVAWPKIFAWGTLLATSLRLPGELPAQLNQWLTKQSSGIAGSILDGLAIPSLIVADKFGMRGLEFSLSECFTSFFSIFALSMAVVLILLLTHRSLMVGILTLLSVPMWAIVHKVLLLLSIVLLKQYRDRDASQGLDHSLLDMGIFIGVVLCCWATTWFLSKMLLPVPAADSQFEPEFKMLNAFVCWPQADPFAIEDRAIPIQEETVPSAKRLNPWLERVSMVGALGLVLFGIGSMRPLIYGGYSNNWLPSIQAERLASTEWKQLFPASFDRWKLVEETHGLQMIDGFERATITWNFAWQGQIVQLTVTTPFKRHQRLAAKYEALGWRVLSENGKRYTVPNANLESAEKKEQRVVPNSGALWTELNINNELGGQATALVAYHPLQQPEKNTALPTDQESVLKYQVVLFCESGEKLTAQQLAELYYDFHFANEHLHTAVEPRLNELLGAAK